MDDFWKAFVRQFRADNAFWYFPHATINTDNLEQKLSVIAEFDGLPWDDSDAARRLRKGRLSSSGAAGARMLRKALENAGLCWLDGHTLRITPSGYALVSGGDRDRVLERVLWRYQLSSPVNKPGPLRIFPHATLLEILQACGGLISRDEFILFVGRTRTPDTLHTVELVGSWRKLNEADKERIIAACGGKFRTRQIDSGYSMNFHTCASYLNRFTDGRGRKGIQLDLDRMQEIAPRLGQHKQSAEWVNFQTTSDYVASLNEVEPTPDLIEAIDHYLDTSQIENAVAAFSRLPPEVRGGKSVEQFAEEAFLEKDLEDYLALNLDAIEVGLVPEGIGRQFPTTVGTMDLFAKATNGDLVVIELKKVRASDKVFGQICRYMGWASLKYQGGGKSVRGYIIGSEIDLKLHFAASVVGDPTIRLRQFRRVTAEGGRIWIEEALPQP